MGIPTEDNLDGRDDERGSRGWVWKRGVGVRKGSRERVGEEVRERVRKEFRERVRKEFRERVRRDIAKEANVGVRGEIRRTSGRAKNGWTRTGRAGNGAEKGAEKMDRSSNERYWSAEI